MRFTAYFILLATLLLWSGNADRGARGCARTSRPASRPQGDWVIVILLLAPFCWRELRARGCAPAARRDWRVLIALGFTGGGLHLALQWLGLHYTTATSAVLYLSMAPIFIMLLALAAARRGDRAQWAGVAISFLGVLISQTAVHADVQHRRPASMAMWGSYTKREAHAARYDKLATPPYLVALCLLGLIFVLPWVAVEQQSRSKYRLGFAGVLAILYLRDRRITAASPTPGGAYVVSRLGAERALAPLMHLDARDRGRRLAALFLGEYPRWYSLCRHRTDPCRRGGFDLRASSAASSRELEVASVPLRFPSIHRSAAPRLPSS